MKNIMRSFIIATTLLLAFVQPGLVYAVDSCDSVNGIKITSMSPSNGYMDESYTGDFIIELSGLDPSNNGYRMHLDPVEFGRVAIDSIRSFGPRPDGTQTITIPRSSFSSSDTTYNIRIYDINFGYTITICDLGAQISVTGSNPGNFEGSCDMTVTNLANFDYPYCGGPDTKFRIRVSNAMYDNKLISGETLELYGLGPIAIASTQAQNGKAEFVVNNWTTGVSDTRLKIVYRLKENICQSSQPIKILDNISSCEDYNQNSQNVSPQIFELCKVAGGGANTPCLSCMRSGGIWSALGCLPINPAEFIPKLVIFASSIAGGVALMAMLFGAATITVSTGNPDSVAKGREIITSAIAGLLLILFSMLLLQLIGVDILQIPGL